MAIIEHDHFPFEFLSSLAERESWRKEIHRPIYHVHKWWAKRLGSVFRGILLGSLLDDDRDLAAEFHHQHDFAGRTRDPTELSLDGASRRICSPPFSETIEPAWPGDLTLSLPVRLGEGRCGEGTEGSNRRPVPRGIYLSCGTSSDTGLADGSIDLVVTDPPFFDNVHYSELADFFYAWQQLDGEPADAPASTRSAHEVQDTRAGQFAAKLAAVGDTAKKRLYVATETLTALNMVHPESAYLKAAGTPRMDFLRHNSDVQR